MAAPVRWLWDVSEVTALSRGASAGRDGARELAHPSNARQVNVQSLQAWRVLSQSSGAPFTLACYDQSDAGTIAIRWPDRAAVAQKPFGGSAIRLRVCVVFGRRGGRLRA